MKKKLLEVYRKLKEAGHPDDFPNVLANTQHKLLLNAFRGVPSPYRSYAKIGNLVDFKTHDRSWLGEAEDLLPIADDGHYETTPMSDYKYQIQLATFGRTFTLSRKTVLNDDLDAFRSAPEKLGRAGARGVAKKCVEVLQGNPLAYDGSAIIRASNSVNGTLTADTTGIGKLQSAIKKIADATDPSTGEKMGLVAKYLIVGTDLAEVAKWLLSSQNTIGSTSSLETNPLLDPALSGKLTLLVEPFLTLTNRWYVTADPNVAPFVEVGFLNGKTEPEVFLKRSDAVRLAGGGVDEFGYDYDDINYKVRYDYAVQPAMYQGIVFGGSGITV